MKIRIRNKRLLITTPFDSVPFMISKISNPFILKKAEIRLNLFLMLLYDYSTDNIFINIERLWRCDSLEDYEKHNKE